MLHKEDITLSSLLGTARKKSSLSELASITGFTRTYLWMLEGERCSPPGSDIEDRLIAASLAVLLPEQQHSPWQNALQLARSRASIENVAEQLGLSIIEVWEISTNRRLPRQELQEAILNGCLEIAVGSKKARRGQ